MKTTLLHKHREIKQVDGFKVGSKFKDAKIDSFSVTNNGIIMWLHKLTKSGNYDLRCTKYGINLNKTIL